MIIYLQDQCSAGGSFTGNSTIDERLNKNVTIPNALSKAVRRGINFEWKDLNSQEKGVRMGFIA